MIVEPSGKHHKPDTMIVEPSGKHHKPYTIIFELAVNIINLTL